jgi:peptide/nickel transport system substrate-binding protein
MPDTDSYVVSGELHLAVRENIRSLNPFVTTNDAEAFVTRMIYDSLLNYEPVVGFSANLAERWEFAGDGGKLTVWLNPRARWHDGAAVTAADVVFTFGLIRGGSLPGWASIAAAVHRVEAISPQEVQILLLDTREEVVRQVCTQVPIVPAAMWQAVTEPAVYSNLEHPVGCGPFVLESYTEAERLVLRNSEEHLAKGPTMDTLVVEIIRDETRALEALNAGQVDALGWDALPTMAADVRDHTDKYPGLRWTAVAGASQRVILFNLRLAPYDDVRLRMALASAVDVTSIIRQVALDLADPATGDPFAPSSEWHDASIPAPSFNAQAATEGLEAAGYRDGNGDGIRERPDGSALLIPITCAKVEAEQKIVALIVAGWKAVGVAAKAAPVAPEQVLPTLMTGSFEAVLTNLDLVRQSALYDSFHSAQGEKRGGLVVGQNYGGYASTAFDRTAELLLEAQDSQERLDLIRQAQRELAADAPWLPLFSPSVLSLYSETRFVGWEPVAGVGLLDRRVITGLVPRD